MTGAATRAGKGGVILTSRRALIQNTTTLFGAQAVSMLAPLLTIPYLARTLGPEGWAPVVAAQALGSSLILLLEYAFDLSGTRAVARARAEPDTMRDVVAGVQGAKLLLIPAAALIVFALFFAMPALHGQLRLLAWTLAYAVCRGLNPLWFFQGIERVQAAVTIDAVSKAAAAMFVFLLVTEPADAWRVLALQAVFSGLSLLVLTRWLMRHVVLSRPTMSAALATLRGTSRLFAMRAAGGVYNQASVLMLAALATAANVSFFGGAERIIRASVSLLAPLTQAFLPRLSYLSVADPLAARRTIERCLLAIGALGAAFGLTALVAAPLLVRILLGPGYEPAVAVLRTMSPLPALVAVNTVLGFYWAVPFGHDRGLLWAVVSGMIVNVALALALVPARGAVGMATAVIAAEVFVTISLAAMYLRHRVATPARAETARQ